MKRQTMKAISFVAIGVGIICAILLKNWYAAIWAAIALLQQLTIDTQDKHIEVLKDINVLTRGSHVQR